MAKVILIVEDDPKSLVLTRDLLKVSGYKTIEATDGEQGEKEGKELIISVSDTGIGIAPEEQERVFEEFYQTGNTIKEKPPGTGLGLPVTRSIVEMHGGRIWIESEGPDKGSRFTFTLPI